MFFSKKKEAAGTRDSEMVKLAEAHLDMVSGGLSFGGPGFGISTAFFDAGAQPQSYNVLPNVVPSQAVPSPSNSSAIGGGLVTANKGGNPDLYAGNPSLYV